jgi:DNA-binding NtrC family response regulator
LNCSVVPEYLLESELFGQAKGYLPDVIWDKKGQVEEADQGTLFLEEIGSLPPLLQTKLLHLLQEGHYRPMGSPEDRSADVRLIATTQQDLAQKVRQREFQENLYYRLNVIQIVMPPLRERREDIPLLARHFLEKYARINQKTIKGLAPEALDFLTGLPWPGNVRELENVIERGVILSKSGVLEIANLFPRPQANLHPAEADEELYQLPFKEAKDRLVSNFHQEYLRRALTRNAGIVSLAAKESGLERPYFHKLMRETRIQAKDFKPFKS